MSVVEYLYQDKKFKDLYGADRTLVLMMVGSFYEAYSVIEGELNNISELIGARLTKKNKTIPKIDEKNPFMLGFPVESKHTFVKKLIDAGYTIIIIDQTSPAPNPRREIVGIYSPGTYIEDTNTESNNTLSIYIEQGLSKLCVGIAILDVSTGECSTSEFQDDDIKHVFDELRRYIIALSPREIIICNKTLNKNMLLDLELDPKTVHYMTCYNKSFDKPSYQDEFIKKIYGTQTMLSPVEYIDMERMPYALISFMILIDFVHKHNENIIKHINKPTIINLKKQLIIENNAIRELNIFDNHETSKIKSLFMIVNQTSTAMGSRFMKNALANPLTDPKIINLRYKCIDALSNFKPIEEELCNIYDIEKLFRKLSLGLLIPYEYVNLIASLQSVVTISNLITNKCVPNLSHKPELLQLINLSDKSINYDIMKTCNFNCIEQSFFNKGVYKEIDNISELKSNSMQYFNNVCIEFSKLVNQEQAFNIKCNDRDGYYLTTSKNKGKLFKDKLKNIDTINIADIIIDTKTIDIRDNKTNVKVTFPDLETKSRKIIRLDDDIHLLIKNNYQIFIQNIFQTFETVFKDVITFISFIDFIKGCAKSAKLFNYKRPEIIEKSSSFMNATKLRHPIIERIRNDVDYIPNDITLGDNNLDGMLIMGINGSSKSSLMKSVGISIIMAQAGMFVPAETFIYSPFDTLFARINGNDNIFKGQSSFTLEMAELRAIIKRANNRSLVIGDEVCRGTEAVSGSAIVASTLIKLSKVNAKFIFATHLHDIADMQIIKDLKNVSAYHLTTRYDEKKDMIIYDRKLMPGSGERVYGLTVAKYIIDDPEFIALAQKIKNDIMQIPNDILADKQSRYNPNVYIHECGVCNTAIKNEHDTHHIRFQEHCDQNGFTKEDYHIKKNNKSNLVVLCKKCHHDVHENRLIISGYIDTSSGRQLKYYYNHAKTHNYMNDVMKQINHLNDQMN